MTKQRKIYLHTGSNLGGRAAMLAEARRRIAAEIGPIRQTSAIYETEAWGYKKQPPFLNQALEVESALPPSELLHRIKTIESEMGRTRTQKWRQRLIDIDILFYGDQVIEQGELVVPHPNMQERNFVLVPLMEIAPELVHPKLKKTIEELYWECRDPSEVVLLEEE